MTSFSIGLTLCCLFEICGIFTVQGSTEAVYFTKLKNSWKPILAIVDRPVTIDCSLSSKYVNVNLYKMTKQGKEKMSPNGTTLKRRNDVFTLTISAFADAGKYYCHGERYGNVYEREIIILVIATAQDMTPQPEIFPAVAEPVEGKTLRLTCSARGRLTIIKWYKDGQLVVIGGGNVFINSTLQKDRTSVSTLSIMNVTASDSGKYRCTVTTNLDTGYRSYIEAKVNVREMILYWSTSMDSNLIVVGSKTAAVLDCSLSMSDAKVSFLRENKDGTLFELPVTEGRYEMLGKQQLVIHSVSVSDMGIYVCKTDGIKNKRTSLYITPEKDVCVLFRPSGLRRLCQVNREQFKQFISGILRQIKHV